jgi:hypothetical protein
MSEQPQGEQLITEMAVRYAGWMVFIRRQSLDSDSWYWQQHSVADKIWFGDLDAAQHAALVFLKAKYESSSLRENANHIEGEANQAVLRISSASVNDGVTTNS